MLNKFKGVVLVWFLASLVMLTGVQYIKFWQDSFVSSQFKKPIAEKFSQLPWSKREVILDEIVESYDEYESHKLTAKELFYRLDKIGFQIDRPESIKESTSMLQKYWFLIWLFLLPLMMIIEYVSTKLQSQKTE